MNPIKNCFIVNLGDMLSLWSSGLYQSTLHRVIPPKLHNIDPKSIEFNNKYPHNSTKIGRISIPFFYEPNWETMVEPINLNIMNAYNNTCMNWDEYDIKKWEKISKYRSNLKSIQYGYHLKSKIENNFYG